MKTVFVKRNDEYCEQYRLKTEILVEGNRKHVVKKILAPEAKDHLINMFYGREKLKEYYSDFEICSAVMRDDEIWFDFVEGESLTKKFMEARQGGKQSDFFYWLDYYVKLIQGNSENKCNFFYTDGFKDYFGDFLDLEGIPALKFTPFDITSNNIIIRENKSPVLIDYEWCLDFPVPIDLVIYRCISNLYQLYPDFDQFIPLKKVLNYLNLNTKYSLLKNLWDHFYQHIIKSPKTGKSYFDIIANYIKKRISINGVEGKIREELLEVRRYIFEYEKLTKIGFAEKDQYINELETQMKTGFAEKDQYINELETQIKIGFAEKDQYINELKTQMKTGFAEKDQYINELKTQMKTGFAEKDQYINELETQIKIRFAEKDQYIAKVNEDIDYLKGIIREKESSIERQDIEIGEKNEGITSLRKELFEIQTSFAWKIAKVFHKK